MTDMEITEAMILTVKEDLPKVRVNHEGKVRLCQTAGRKNRFCTVYLDETGIATLEYSWHAIARAHFANTILKTGV